MQYVLNNNPDLETISKIGRVLDGVNAGWPDAQPRNREIFFKNRENREIFCQKSGKKSGSFKMGNISKNHSKIGFMQQINLI
jgi:hypothetical protein